MQSREGLCGHPTSRYQAENRYHGGQKEQILNASFQERLGLLVSTNYDKELGPGREVK
jgi:hypothetical protein